MKTFLTLIFLLGSLASYSQSSEVTALKKDLAAATDRANRAEEQARLSATDAQKFQQQAEQARMRAERAEAAATRCRYLFLAKLLSIKSLELSADPQQEALVALLAFRFNTRYGGGFQDNDIHKGLLTALTLFNDPAAKNPANQDMAVIAGVLCKYVKRDLTDEEWMNFIGSDLKREKVCEN